MRRVSADNAVTGLDRDRAIQGLLFPYRQLVTLYQYELHTTVSLSQGVVVQW